MTRHPVSKRYHLAIAAVLPLVLAMCATPPVAELGTPYRDIEAPSATTVAAAESAEPSVPAMPLMTWAAPPHAVQPVLDARVAGAGGVSIATPHIQPQRPAHPQRSELLSAAPVGEPGLPRRPAGAGADGIPRQREHGVPERPMHPELSGTRITAPEQLGTPAVPGTGEAPAMAAQVEPERPRHPAMIAAPPPFLPYPQPVGAVGPAIIQRPTDAEIDRVRVLIARAEEVGAPFYDPRNLGGARDALRTSERIRGVDPGGSYLTLKTAEAGATAAFDNSVRLAAERLRKLLHDRLAELREIQADLWVPASFQEMVDAVQRAEDLYRSGDHLGAYGQALTAVDDMLALRNSLLDRLELLYGTRTETELCLAAVQHLDTSDWSAARLRELGSLYRQLNALYLTGLEAVQSYRLADAEEAFGAAIEVCRRLLDVADEAYTEQMERAAALLTAVMDEIEAASELTVVTDTGDVIMPQPWSGPPVLAALRAGAARRTAVLDGIDREGGNDLRRAEALWIDGVLAFDDRKYAQSIQLFEDARRYLERYKLDTVMGVHTVQLIPERRESLWRIAEYDHWYGDPFRWPRIWRKNRDLIQNPDLIYPNWNLIIPAL